MSSPTVSTTSLHGSVHYATAGETEPRPLRKPPLALPERVPRYDPRDIVMTSRNVR
jgi:hypothetical protein